MNYIYFAGIASASTIQRMKTALNNVCIGAYIAHAPGKFGGRAKDVFVDESVFVRRKVGFLLIGVVTSIYKICFC